MEIFVRIMLKLKIQYVIVLLIFFCVLAMAVCGDCLHCALFPAFLVGHSYKLRML
jgi:hypothetical protein